MSRFASFCTIGNGDLYYIDWETRKINLSRNNDSHAFIAKHHNLNEDKCNKYEYNPLTKRFVIDQLNTIDDVEIIKRKLEVFDWKNICEPLIVKPIVNPFDIDPQKITPEIIALVKKWTSVRGLIEHSAGVLAWASIKGEVDDSIMTSVSRSVRSIVKVMDWDMVWIYIGSFFNLPRAAWQGTQSIAGDGYHFQPAVDLWNMGFVPYLVDGNWYLASKNGNIKISLNSKE